MAKLEKTVQKTDFDPQRQQKGQEKSMRRRQLMAERKKFKRNQRPKGPRRKDWTPAEFDDTDSDGWNDGEYESFERIMPLDEADRRRALARTSFRANPQEPDTPRAIPALHADATLSQGRVTALANALCRVAVGSETWLCAVRGTIHAQETGFTNALAVGDEVLVRAEGDGHGVVEHVMPRRTILARPDVFYPHLQQLVVANADQLLIVASWRDPIIWFELIDRYLVAAARHELPAVICVNKIDLATSRAECERDLQPYHALDIRYLLTSAQSGEGIDELRAILHGRTTVLAGLSGVGKSSLLSALQPELRLRVGDVSEHSGEGRHTTTQATLLALDAQSGVVDTPGIREFGLSGLTRSQLAAFFPDIAGVAARCRFRDCTHHAEPGCAVRAAVSAGEIASSRAHSYHAIYASLPGQTF